MWCPVCGVEYREGFNTCNDCGCALTKNKPEPVLVKGQDINNLVHLHSCDSDFEADVIISLLESCDIIAVKRYKNFSHVAKLYCGSSNLGVEIFVGELDFESAKEILSAEIINAEDNNNEYGDIDEEG